MRYLRRNDTAIKPIRDLFKRIRKDTRTTYHATIAYALVEFARDDKKSRQVCQNVLELVGMKQWEKNVVEKNEAEEKEDPKRSARRDDTGFIKFYLQYRLHQPDPDNTRQLFERSLSVLPAAQQEDVWKMYHSFETDHGDLNSVQELERKSTPVLGTTHVQQLIDRYCFQELNPCTQAALQTFGITTGSSSSSSGGGSSSHGHSHRPPAHAPPRPAGGPKAAMLWPIDDKGGAMKMPDTHQLRPFITNRALPHGRVYPPAIKELLMRLPPAPRFLDARPPVILAEALLKEIQTREIPLPTGETKEGSAEKRKEYDEMAAGGGDAQRVKVA